MGRFTDRFRKPVLDYLYVPITFECNRNCKGCVCYSPLAGKETRVSLDHFKKAINRLVEITGTETIQQFDISGGEPLLHPDILEFIKFSREVFKYSNIYIRTNGLLLPEFIENNFKLLKELNVSFEYSIYPEVDHEGISYLCRKHNLCFHKHWESSDFKFFKAGVNQRPNYRNMNEEWFNCCDINSCKNLRIIDDKIAYYTGCSTPVYIDILDKYFGTNYESLIKKGDRVNIYDSNTTLDDLLNFHQPIMFCAHCRRRTGIFFNNNETSEKSKDEWIVDDLANTESCHTELNHGTTAPNCKV